MIRKAGGWLALISIVSLVVLFVRWGESPLPYGTQVWDKDRVHDGYTLITRLDKDEAMLIDLDGSVFHRWRLPKGAGFQCAEFLSDGSLGVVRTHKFNKGLGEFLVLDWDSRVKRRVRLNTHHDFEELDNGNFLFMTRHLVDDADLAPYRFISDGALELDSRNRVVWRWALLDHVDQIKKFIRQPLPPYERDWAHMNALQVIPPNAAGDKDPRFKAGNLLFSIQRFDAIGVIERETGEVVWAYGGKPMLDGQHTPSFLPSGRILVFDNGYRRKFSRVLEVDPLSNKVVWEYPKSPTAWFFTQDRGSAQRLPNGNTLVSLANKGQLVELTRDGEVVWEFFHPDFSRYRAFPTERKAIRSISLYRAVRYDRSQVQRWRADQRGLSE